MSNLRKALIMIAIVVAIPVVPGVLFAVFGPSPEDVRAAASHQTTTRDEPLSLSAQIRLHDKGVAWCSDQYKNYPWEIRGCVDRWDNKR